MIQIRLTQRLAAAALLAVVGGAVPALAQTTPDTTTPGATAPGGTPPNRMTQERVEKHIAELHRRLHITPQEEPTWTAFAQVMRDNAAHMDQVFRARSESPNMNAMDDLRSYAAVAQAHAEDMQRLLPAFQTLYTSLSPEQQHTADQVFRDFEKRRGRRNPAG